MAHFTAETLTNATVYGRNGEKIGKVAGVYENEQTGEPTFVTVSTGLFGTKETFVPVGDAWEENGDLNVPYTKDFIKDAPNMDPDEHLSEEEQDRLYAYYGVGGAGSTTGTAGTDTTGTTESGGTSDDAGAAGTATDTSGAAGAAGTERDTDTEAEVIRREEQLNVGKETQERRARFRLRKYVTTDTETVQVPVSREEVRVEQIPVGEDEEVSGGPLGEDEAEVTLREERPVVSKETVGAEKVSLSKETVKDTERVQAEVAKEHVEVEGADTDRDRDTR
jgi:uncharacterized protein (TIGR02271 family)